MFGVVTGGCLGSFLPREKKEKKERNPKILFFLGILWDGV